MIKGRFSSSAEYVIYGTNGAHDSDGEKAVQNVISCPTLTGDDKEHIAEKPIEVMKWVLAVTKANSTILDPFMGSGTTLRAAKDLRRKAIGIEIEEKYCEISAKRLSQEVFDFAPPTEA